MQTLPDFIVKVQTFYKDNYRSMPWREHIDPYHIMVSELMLQQTQVGRVIPKFETFIQRFPTITVLAKAQQSEVLAAWSGLGYNRRAKFLHEAARVCVEKFKGSIPDTYDDLLTLPGIGPNTAGAILVYAYNQPIVFIETNIRSVFLHEFFPGKTDISDKQLMPLIEESLDSSNPREWYWALMDYGTYIKKNHPNPSRRSSHHVSQSPFEGSKRQIRGRIIKQLLRGPQTKQSLQDGCGNDARFDEVIDALEAEKMVHIFKDVVSLDA